MAVAIDEVRAGAQ